MSKNENAQLVQLTTNLPRFSRKVVQGIAPDGSRSAAYRGPSPEPFPRCLAETFRGATMRMPSSSESARRGQKSSICGELVLENLTSRKLTWANKKPRWAVLPRRPFQTHISTISVHDAEFSAKKGGPVASRPAKRQYHERHFTTGKRSRQKLHASHNAYRGKRRSLRRVGFPMEGQLECKTALEDAYLVL